MIWNNVELFNVYETEKRTDGAIKLYRFPKAARDRFAIEKPNYVADVGNMTTGCEIRFVTKAADVLISSEYYNGTVEIYRGDFFCRVEHLQAGVIQRITLREDTALDVYPITTKKRFAPNVWRIVFDHDYCAVIHDIHAFAPIRPPMQSELPDKKLLAYGSSITHSAHAVMYTNSYLYTLARALNVDAMCKGMGGSCFVQKEVADYIHSVVDPVDTIITGVLEKAGINGKSSMADAISKIWQGGAVDEATTTTFADNLSSRFQTAITTAIDGIDTNKLKKPWHKIMESLTSDTKFEFNIDKNWDPSKGGSPILSVTPNWSSYATGGFPEDGLFYANHNELVGRFSNGKTAVANNAQIVEGIKYGVKQAMMEAMANGGFGSGEITIHNHTSLDGREVAQNTNKYNSTRGTQIFGNQTNYNFGF
jgi:hypothetical protein